MILGGAPSGAGIVAFPDPPTGSHDEIAAIARALSGAGDDFEHVHTGLDVASATLATDWQGYAAAAYHACSDGLAAVARGGATTFRDCAHALTGYSAALDHAQSEIRRLRVLYDAATAAQASAATAALTRQNKLASTTKAADVLNLNNSIASAQTNAQNAAHDANGYARQATTVLDEFKQAQARYADVLAGERLTPNGGPAPGSPWTPFAPAGAPGPGFGLPNVEGTAVPGLLASDFGGVIPVGNPWSSQIPGYSFYYNHIHDNATSPDDITNLVALVASFGAGGALKDLTEGELKQFLTDIGIGSGARASTESKAQAEAFKAVQQLMDSGATRRSTSLSKLVPGAVRDGRALGVAKAEVAQAQTRADIADALLKVADAKGWIPPGIQGLVSEALHHGSTYFGYAVSRLVAAQAALLKAGTPAAHAVAYAIGVILGAGR